MGRRLLLLNTDLEVGGTPTVVRELATRLHAPQRGVEVEVACVAPRGPVAEQIERVGVRVTAFDADDVFDLPLVVRRLVKLIRERSIDTVFSFLVHANTVAALASRFARDVRFLQSIQTTQPRPPWHWWMQSLVQHAAEMIVVPSASTADAAAERAGVPREKIVIISNAVDADALGGASRSRGRGAGAFAVAFVGRLDPVKRIPDLIASMAKLGGDNHLSLYGEGAQRDELRKLIEQLGLQERVTLRGTVPAREALAESDLLVLPSEAEGFGLVLIEAMAAGVPVVATDAPGIRDVVEHERTGLLVPVGDVDALAAAIGRCASDAALRQRLTARATEVVRTKLSWPVVLQQYRQLLRI